MAYMIAHALSWTQISVRKNCAGFGFDAVKRTTEHKIRKSSERRNYLANLIQENDVFNPEGPDQFELMM
jgi:hypothetical protein